MKIFNLLGICCILLLWEVFKIFQRGRIILSFLTEIKEQVKEYAEIVAGFVDCEVEIVDENMLRIAATGKFAHLVGKFSKGAIYKDVLVNGESHVVENPSQHRLCADCEFKERCQEKLEIAAPIVHKGKRIGVIGIVALTDIIKYKVLRNVSLYLDFTEQISDFISETISEHEKKENRERMDIIKEVINSFDKCAVILDENDIIIDANQKAVKELDFEENFRDKKIKLEAVPLEETVFGKEIFNVKIEEKEIKAVGIFVSAGLIAKKDCKILFFNKYRG